MTNGYDLVFFLVSNLAFLGIGALLAYLVTILTQKSAIERAREDERNERVYSPLYDELEEALQTLDKWEYRPPNKEWARIRKVEHLTYMVPKGLRDRLTQLYDTQYEQYDATVRDCNKRMEEFVRSELMSRLVGAYSSYPYPADISNVIGIGYDILGGKLIGDTTHLNEINTSYFRMKRGMFKLEWDSVYSFFEYLVSASTNREEIKEAYKVRKGVMDSMKEIRNTLGKSLKVED